jgi:hypothetical protein
MSIVVKLGPDQGPVRLEAENTSLTAGQNRTSRRRKLRKYAEGNGRLTASHVACTMTGAIPTLRGGSARRGHQLAVPLLTSLAEPSLIVDRFKWPIVRCPYIASPLWNVFALISIECMRFMLADGALVHTHRIWKHAKKRALGHAS